MAEQRLTFPTTEEVIRELRAGEPQAPATRRRLQAVGWFNFSLTIAVPVLGVVILSLVD